ncbi:MAG: WD40 repeat domain-containing protein [Aggregatilineales bacterium]
MNMSVNPTQITRRWFGVGALGIALTLSMLFSSGNDPVQATSAPTVAATAPSGGALQPITPDNAQKLTPLPRLGRGYVSDIEWSPDDKTLAIAGSLGVWLYATANLSEQPRLLPDDNTVRAMVFSADGAQLTTVDNSDTVRMWDVASGSVIKSLPRVISGFFDIVAFNQDGHLMAFTGQNQLTVWNVTLNKAAMVTKIAPANEYLMAISPDGSYLATSPYDLEITLWDGKTGKQVAIYDLTNYAHSELTGISFSPNSKRLVVTAQDAVLLGDVVSGQFHVMNTSGRVYSAVFSQDGQRLLTGGFNGAIAVWDANSGALVKSLQTPSDLYNVDSDAVYTIAFSSDGQRLATVVGSGSVLIWDIVNDKPPRLVQTDAYLWSDLAFSPDGRQLATADSGANISIWNVSDNALLYTLPNHGINNFMTLVTFSPDGKQIVTGDNSATIRFWDTTTGKVLHSFQANLPERLRLSSLAFNPNGRQLAIVGYHDYLQLLDPQSGAETVHLQGGGENIDQIAYSPDGHQIAVSDTKDNNLRVWDTATGTLIATFKNNLGNYVDGLVFSPDGQYLATGDSLGLVALWDVAHTKLLIALKGHHDKVTHVVFSPDGQLLASAGADNQILIWSVAKRSLRTALVYSYSDLTLNSIAFSPDGTRLVAAGNYDGTVWGWGVPGGVR